MNAASLVFVCAAGVCAGATPAELLTPPALGKLMSETPVDGRVAVQRTPGAHQGHAILDAHVTLQPRAKPGTAERWGYAIRRHACLDVDKHSGGVEVCPKEGLSGIGMTRPSSSNWYSGGFIGVRLDGKGIGSYRSKLTRLTYASGAVAARAVYTLPEATVALTFLQRPNETFCRVHGTIDGRAGAVEVRLRCFPCVTKPTGQRVAWSATRCVESGGSLRAGLKDCWFLLADKAFDRAKGRKGQGPCAVLFDPAQVKAAKANVGPYACSVTLTLLAGTNEFRLALWEFPRWTNARALAHLRELDKRLTIPLGLTPTAEVLTRDVPARAIVVDGAPAASIVIPAEAHERLIQGALEIQEYVKKSTGAVLPIVQDAAQAKGHAIRLAVEPAPAGQCGEAFRVRVADRRTDVVGASPLGALYGAYELLERGLGVRWYVPGPLGEVVPRRQAVVLPALDVKRRPSFPMRWIGRGPWMLRNRQNRCDDGFLVYPSIYHTQNRLLGHREYFPKHPEYFALIKGRRSDEHECKLCYSNPDVVREVARNMAAMLDANPNIKLISLSPTDGQMWCECDGCRAMDEPGVERDRRMSRRSLLFYNAVAAELRKTHPKARMLVGAYNVYNWPPKDASVKADPMIDVIITHYEDYCMAHPVPDADCPLNRRYVELIRAWQALGCRVYFYEYYWKVNWLDLPWPIVHSIRKDMPWYKQTGCQGVYTQFNPDCIWAQFPVHYVAARLLWDVDADVDAIMAEMFDGLFGRAAPHMKAYWDLIETRMGACGKHFPGRGLSMGPAVFTPEVRAEMHRLHKAAVAANSDPMVAQRLTLIGRSLEYTDRLMRFAALRQATVAERDAAKAYARAKEALDALERLVKEVRTERAKWAGVVSRSVVGKRHYMGKTLRAWRKAVERRRVAIHKTVAPLPATWRFALDRDDVGCEQKWFAPEFDDTRWKPIRIGQTWESQGYEYDGVAWYRVHVDVKSDWLKEPLALFFGAVDGEASVYFNGRLLGRHDGWDEPFSFVLDPKHVHVDKPNTLAVRVHDKANAGGIYKMAHLIKASNQ